MINDDLIEFAQSMPLITEELRKTMLHALNLLNELEVRAGGINCKSSTCFVLPLPLFERAADDYTIPMQFYTDWFEDEQDGEIIAHNTISCGPSSLPATEEYVKGYIDWLDKYMPRNRETLRDTIKAGNPNNLILPKNKES